LVTSVFFSHAPAIFEASAPPNPSKPFQQTVETRLNPEIVTMEGSE
jgi:hypothetical protein